MGEGFVYDSKMADNGIRLRYICGRLVTLPTKVMS